MKLPYGFPYERTALHIAASTDLTDAEVRYHNRSPEGVKLLLDARADPYILDERGDIPLSGARDACTVKLLIEAAPMTVYHKDSQGHNLLMRSFSNNEWTMGGDP